MQILKILTIALTVLFIWSVPVTNCKAETTLSGTTEETYTQEVVYDDELLLDGTKVDIAKLKVAIILACALFFFIGLFIACTIFQSL